MKDITDFTCPMCGKKTQTSQSCPVRRIIA